MAPPLSQLALAGRRRYHPGVERHRAATPRSSCARMMRLAISKRGEKGSALMSRIIPEASISRFAVRIVAPRVRV